MQMKNLDNELTRSYKDNLRLRNEIIELKNENNSKSKEIEKLTTELYKVEDEEEA